MADSPQDSNGRVTMAVLNANVMHLADEMRQLRETVCAQLADHERRMRDVERWNTTSQERWEQHADDHRVLTTKNWAADIIGSLGAFAAALFVGKS